MVYLPLRPVLDWLKSEVPARVTKTQIPGSGRPAAFPRRTVPVIRPPRTSTALIPPRVCPGRRWITAARDLVFASFHHWGR